MAPDPLCFLQRDISQIRSTTLTQFLLNWTLAELADMYRTNDTAVVPEQLEFDVTDVEDWYKQVVMPLLRRFLPNEEAVLDGNIKLAFHEVLYVTHFQAFFSLMYSLCSHKCVSTETNCKTIASDETKIYMYILIYITKVYCNGIIYIYIYYSLFMQLWTVHQSHSLQPRSVCFYCTKRYYNIL